MSKIKVIFIIFDQIFLSIIRNLDGPLGFYLRYKYYKLKCLNLGKNVKFGVGVLIRNPQYVSIGDDTCIDDYAIIIAGHNKNDKRRRRVLKNKNYRGEPGYVIIGENCHIAQNAFLLGIGGCQIGDDSGVGMRGCIYSFTNMYYDYKNREKYISMSNMANNNDQFMMIGPVVMQNNTHVLYDSFVVPGVTLYENSVALPFAKVLNDLKSNGVYEGNPAIFKEYRFKQLR